MSDTNDLLSIDAAADALGVYPPTLKRYVGLGNDTPTCVDLVVVEGISVRALKRPDTNMKQMRFDLFGALGEAKPDERTPWFEWWVSGAEGECPLDFAELGFGADDVVPLADLAEITGFDWSRGWRVNGGRRRVAPISYVRLEQQRFLTPESLDALVRSHDFARLLVHLKQNVRVTNEIDGQDEFARQINAAVEDRNRVVIA